MPVVDHVRNAVLALLLSWAIWPGPAEALPHSVELDPARTAIGFRAFAFGWIPVDGRFQHFHGTVDWDPDHPGQCTITVAVDVRSLVLVDARTRDFILSRDFLDAADWPVLTYHGLCHPQGVAGRLTLHGRTGEVRLVVTRNGGRVRAETVLDRTDWGMTAYPMLVGHAIEIEVSADLPE